MNAIDVDATSPMQVAAFLLTMLDSTERNAGHQLLEVLRIHRFHGGNAPEMQSRDGARRMGMFEKLGWYVDGMELAEMKEAPAVEPER